MSNREQLLTVWTPLKTKLSPLIWLSKHKEIIKATVEFHMNQASSFSSTHSAEGVSVREIDRYRNLEQVERTRPTSPEEPWPGRSAEWRKYHYLLHFFRQKEKNEQIVRECKEVLEKLI